MSHGGNTFSRADAEVVANAEPFRLPRLLRLFCVALIAVGAFFLVKGVTSPESAKRFWAAYQVNMIYWTVFAVACSSFTAVFQICNAKWVRPIRRLFEGASFFLLLTPIFLLVPYLCGAYNHIFIWSHMPAAGKEGWLTPNFVYIRDLVALLVLVFMGRKAVRFSMAKDILAVRAGLVKGGDRYRGSEYDHYTFGLSPSKESIKEINDRFVFFSPVVVILYALCMSLIAFDQSMSVDPAWYSTMFGAFVFMGAVYITMAWMAMMVGVCRQSHPVYRQFVNRKVLHDLGKLLFGFGIFWTYLFWSQYLPIWYGNMPEETAFIISRLREQPWHDLSWVVLGGCFMIPFMMGLSRDIKQIPILLFCTGLIVGVSMWLQHYVIFVPSLFPNHIPLDLAEVMITLGFAGLFLLAYDHHMKKVPLIPFGDVV